MESPGKRHLGKCVLLVVGYASLVRVQATTGATGTVELAGKQEPTNDRTPTVTEKMLTRLRSEGIHLLQN